jgi:hypothetical protein
MCVQRNICKAAAALIAVALVAGELSLGLAHAQAPAAVLVPGMTHQLPEYTIGWGFTVVAPIRFNALGWFDAGSDGLVSNHDVGLFTAPAAGAGTLLASTIVSSADPLLSGYRYHSTAWFLLSAGDYVIAGVTGDDLWQSNGQKLVTHESIRFNGGLFTNVGVLTYPTSPSDRGLAYFGPNFLLTAVPEPSTVVLASFAAVLIGRRRVYRRPSSS